MGGEKIRTGFSKMSRANDACLFFQGEGEKGGNVKRLYTMLAMLLVDNLVEATAH